MNNMTALFLAIFLVGFFLVDQLYFGGTMRLTIARKMLVLVEYLAFWR